MSEIINEEIRRKRGRPKKIDDMKKYLKEYYAVVETCPDCNRDYKRSNKTYHYNSKYHLFSIKERERLTKQLLKQILKDNKK